MANSVQQGGTKVVTLDTTGEVDLDDAHPRALSSWILHVKVGGGAPATFVPKLRVIGSELSGSDLHATIYWDEDSETAIAAGTAISANGIYTIPCDGCELVLDVTADTDDVTVYAYPIIG